MHRINYQLDLPSSPAAERKSLTKCFAIHRAKLLERSEFLEEMCLTAELVINLHNTHENSRYGDGVHKLTFWLYHVQQRRLYVRTSENNQSKKPA